MSGFYGNIFSKNEEYAYKKGYRIDKNGNVYGTKHNILKPYINKKNYKTFGIKQNNQVIHISYHRFQAYMKFGDKIYEEGICVRHLNSNSLDNTWDNIEIGTASDNMLDIPKERRQKITSYISNKRKNAFSKEKIIAIKEAHKNGLSYREIMDKFDVSSKGTISYIINHKHIYYNID